MNTDYGGTVSIVPGAGGGGGSVRLGASTGPEPKEKPACEPFTRLLITHLLAVFGWGGAWWAVNTYAPEQMPLALHCGICLLLVLTAGARFAAARANLTARRAIEGLELERTERHRCVAQNVLDILSTFEQSGRRTDAIMRQREESANHALARLDKRCDEIGAMARETTRITSLEQRLDATIEKQDEIERKYLNVDRAVADLLRAKRGGGSACPEPGRGVPYAPQGVCRDAADAQGAIFDALELVAKGETHVPEHIEVGDRIIFDGNKYYGAGDRLRVEEVLATSPATVEIAGGMRISRDHILAHCPKEA